MIQSRMPPLASILRCALLLDDKPRPIPQEVLAEKAEDVRIMKGGVPRTLAELGLNHEQYIQDWRDGKIFRLQESTSRNKVKIKLPEPLGTGVIPPPTGAAPVYENGGSFEIDGEVFYLPRIPPCE